MRLPFLLEGQTFLFPEEVVWRRGKFSCRRGRQLTKKMLLLPLIFPTVKVAL